VKGRDIPWRLVQVAWLVVLIGGPALVLILSGLSFWSAQRGLVRIDRQDLAAAADAAAGAADVYVARVINDLASITAEPDVQTAATRQNESPQDLDRDREVDDLWKKRDPRADAAVQKILDSPTSAYLRAVTTSSGSIVRELLLSDTAGRLVAASNRSDDYLQSDDLWWPPDIQGLAACHGPLADCALVQDVGWDSSSGTYGIAVTLPVMSVEKRLVGIMKAVVDPAELTEVIQSSDKGIELALVDRKGKLALGTAQFFTAEALDTIRDLARGGQALVEESARRDRLARSAATIRSSRHRVRALPTPFEHTRSIWPRCTRLRQMAAVPPTNAAVSKTS